MRPSLEPRQRPWYKKYENEIALVCFGAAVGLLFAIAVMFALKPNII